MASAFIVFYAVRMDAPEIRMKIDCSIMEYASSDRLYRLLMNTRLARSLGDIGKLRWRILMLVSTLGVLFVSLRQSLYQLREESVARTAANEAVRLLASPGMIITQQLDMIPERIVLRMTVTEAVAEDRVREAEKLLLRRTGKEVTVSVRQVASEEELALLRERFRTRVKASPAVFLAKAAGHADPSVPLNMNCPGVCNCFGKCRSVEEPTAAGSDLDVDALWTHGASSTPPGTSCYPQCQPEFQG